MNTELRGNVAGLLRETGRAHHKAFKATDGADPDWPIWYADYSRDAFAEQFGIDLTRSQLVYCLMNASFEHDAREPERPWPEYYAEEIVERFAPAKEPSTDTLALYYMEGCPFCNRVRSAIQKLGIDVELRDVIGDQQHREDLVAVRGRATVPVLRITSSDGEERWMPESADIIRYLDEHYG